MVKLPVFHRFVQLESYYNMDPDVADFLDQHASKPLEEIHLDETNDFLRESYYRYVEERNDELR